MDCVCIVCPVSCRMSIEEKNGEYIVSGNTCPRGKNHAINEFICPKRMLTSTVYIDNGILPRLPIISSDEILKSDVQNCLKEIYGVKIQAPVKQGDVIIANICNSGVDMLAARDMKKID